VKATAGVMIMPAKASSQLAHSLTLPQPTSADLRGRQSVRATFRLSSRAIAAIHIAAAQLGIKQKSLFDHLMDDAPALEVIARKIDREKFSELKRRQKTFVVSRRTLAALDEISRQFDMPRDALVEYSILRLLPMIHRERQRHSRRKQVLKEFEDFLRQGWKILENARSHLGKEDPVCLQLQQALRACTNARKKIASLVERGKMIEDF